MVSENSKTWQTVCCLKDQCAAGTYPDGKLPKETVLAEELNVSRNTLRAALSLLEKDGLIVRKRHAGTRWIGESPLNKNSASLPVIGLLARTIGHVFSDFYQQILKELTRYNWGIRVVNIDYIDKSIQAHATLEKNINRLLNTDLKALLVDGYCFRLMPHSKQLMERRPIFFDFLDGPSPDGEYTGIWLDYEKAGYLGGKYLLEHGCKHPLFIPSRLPYYTRMQPENYCRHKERQFIAGFSRVLQENGMDPMCYILDPFYTQKNLEMLFYNLLADPVVKPDGVFASRDYEIITFLKIASELRIDIPSIKLVGGGNTPWSQKDSLHPFTSIDFHFDKCAKKLMEQAQLHPDQRTDIYIEPELLERD